MSAVARRIVLVFGLVLALAMSSQAGPADGLFRLVPPEAAATLAIEDLRQHARDFLASPVAERLQRLPVFQEWLASGSFARFDQARQRIESVMGERVATIRDELLGDAVVLALRAAPDGRPEGARGLFLVRVRNRPLLDRLMRDFNAAQKRSGELVENIRLSRLGVTYWGRKFRQGPQARRLPEYLTVLDDDTVAWSNAEDLIQGVIDRRAGTTRSLADEPRFQQVRRRLPGGAAVSLFVDPPFLSRLLADSARPPKGQGPAGDRMAALVGRYVSAMDYLGAALTWRDGIVLHTEEVLDPQKLDPWVRRWAAQRAEIAPRPASRGFPRRPWPWLRSRWISWGCSRCSG